MNDLDISRKWEAFYGFALAHPMAGTGEITKWRTTSYRKGKSFFLKIQIILGKPALEVRIVPISIT